VIRRKEGQVRFWAKGFLSLLRREVHVAHRQLFRLGANSSVLVWAIEYRSVSQHDSEDNDIRAHAPKEICAGRIDPDKRACGHRTIDF